MARVDDRPFNEFVTVKAPRGQRQNISSAHQAAEWLLFRWPKNVDTQKARAARKPALRCWRDSERQRQPGKAFREAAEEAGILIGDVDRVPHREGRKAQTVVGMNARSASRSKA
jgi:hypothetical protein